MLYLHYGTNPDNMVLKPVTLSALRASKGVAPRMNDTPFAAITFGPGTPTEDEEWLVNTYQAMFEQNHDRSLAMKNALDSFEVELRNRRFAAEQRGAAPRDVREIIERWLRENGFDGLFCSECSCVLDDLMPCSSDSALMCEPGYRKDGCPPECGMGCDFHIVPEKP